MVLEYKNENDIKFIQFNDESSRNAIGSEDWSSLITQIDEFEKSEGVGKEYLSKEKNDRN